MATAEEIAQRLMERPLPGDVMSIIVQATLKSGRVIGFARNDKSVVVECCGHVKGFRVPKVVWVRLKDAVLAFGLLMLLAAISGIR